MPGDLLDLILIAVIAAFAVAGYRQGFIIGVLSLVGFLAGVAAGAYIAPGISRALARSTTWQAFLAILVVFAMAVIGMMIASGIGVALRSRLIGRPATVVDSLGGATVNVLAVVIVAWLIGSFILNSSAFPAVSRQVNNSAVLRTVDRVMPRSVLYLPFFPQLRSLLSNGLYSQVFGAFGAESSIGLPAPDPSVVSSAALNRAESSIVKVTGEATSCSQTIEGSGFVISPQHVLTNAHVVAGVDLGLSVTADANERFTARVVLYDPERDLAVLYVPGLTAASLPFGGPASDGTSAAVAGYPLNHSLSVVPARIGHSFTATGPDIYQTGSVNRQMYAVRAVIQPGNSGGPLLSAGGQVYGVVFAASTYYPDTGYALTASEVASDAAAGSHDYGAVQTQGCQDG
ncbi:MAG: MarP family serine protease [Streptosporangiaceae bacterium]